MYFKRIAVWYLFGFALLFMSGCDVDVDKKVNELEEKMANKIASIIIPFEWFKEDPEDIEEVVIEEVRGINLKEETVNKEHIALLEENLEEISEKLKDEENFKKIVSGNKNIFNILGSQYFSLRYGEDGDDLTSVMQDIGTVPYQFVNTVTLRQYGAKANENGEKETYAVIDVNAVNDTLDFRIYTLMLRFDEHGSVDSSVQLGEPVDKPNTFTPLTKDSLLAKNTHVEFQRNLKKVMQALSNEGIYEQISLGETDGVDTAISALTKKIGIESKNNSTIHTLIQHGKGVFEEWGVTGYLFDDKDVVPITYYELTVSDENGQHHYTVHFHRGLNKITNISKGSPFEEVLNNEKEN